MTNTNMTKIIKAYGKEILASVLMVSATIYTPIAEAGKTTSISFTPDISEPASSPYDISPYGINNAGNTVGFYNQTPTINMKQPFYNGYERAAWSDMTETPLNYKKDGVVYSSQVTDINNNNIVFGNSYNNVRFSGFLTTDKGITFTNLDVSGAQDVYIIGGNDSNVSSGFMTDTNGNASGILCTSTGTCKVAIFPSTSPTTTSNFTYSKINNDSVVAGSYFNSTDALWHGFTHDTIRDVVTPFNVPGAQGTFPQFVCGNGVWVGFYFDSTGAENGVVYNPANKKNPYTLLTPSLVTKTTGVHNVTSFRLVDMNNSGEAIGRALVNGYNKGIKVSTGLTCKP